MLLTITLIFTSFVISAQDPSQVEDESSCSALFLKHLRNNFDDIHDVSMRLHHLDHELNGIIALEMVWEGGRLISCSVLENETGNESFPADLGSAIGKWQIEEMPESCEFSFSFRIKIVGSDDPSFSEKAIFTGEVLDNEGNPVKEARISLRRSGDRDDSVSDSRTNREGIFVRTLIPPGTWNISISCPGYEDVILENSEFRGGEHKREKVVMKMLNSN